MRIHHFAIQVKNIDISIKFYTEKLGFKIKIPKTAIKTPKTITEDGFYCYLTIDSQDVDLELVQINNKNVKKNNTTSFAPPICPHIGLKTDNFDEDLELLKKRKVQIFDGPHIIPNDVKMLTILDPDGYRIDIGQLLR